LKNESRRQKKIASLLREVLGPILIDELQAETGGLVTVTRVEVPADLRIARVYLSVFGTRDPEAAVAHLEVRAGHLRRRLASAVNLKYNPQLFFRLDPSASDVERIDRLLDASKRDDGPRD
jgi:ribosome-binding factor A